MSYKDEIYDEFEDSDLEPEWKPFPGGTIVFDGGFGLTFVALILIIFMSIKVIKDRIEYLALPVMQYNLALIRKAPPVDHTAISSPYDVYTLTQGPHGASYGQMAIDISAGKGASIKSPIHGVVTDLYVDVYGNPTLFIENDHYQVALLHGIYTVSVGDALLLGQKIGVESNLGYTKDMQGIPCSGRDCGYHTHLNIFDKRLSENINPLAVLGN